MIENVIFDVDGTLWDCSAAVAKAWNAVYERRGLSRRFSVSEVRSCMGLTMEEIAEKYFFQTERTERDEIVRSCIAEQNALLPKEGGKLYPNIRETLKTLSARFGVYIVSNCECGYIETMLSFARLESFVDGFLCAGMTGKDKGENLRLLMAEHALKKLRVRGGYPHGRSRLSKGGNSLYLGFLRLWQTRRARGGHQGLFRNSRSFGKVLNT